MWPDRGYDTGYSSRSDLRSPASKRRGYTAEDDDEDRYDDTRYDDGDTYDDTLYDDERESHYDGYDEQEEYGRPSVRDRLSYGAAALQERMGDGIRYTMRTPEGRGRLKSALKIGAFAVGGAFVANTGFDMAYWGDEQVTFIDVSRGFDALDAPIQVWKGFAGFVGNFF